MSSIAKNYTQVQQREAQVSQYPNKETGFGINYENYKEEHCDWLYTTKKKEA